ncbi:MAG: pilus assembly protein N-terminal domain-containing protein [Rubripirellula sp.]
MRDSRKQLADSTRRKRRAFLMAMLWTATNVVHCQWTSAADSAMPPLPLNSSADMKTNPFCEPSAPAMTLPLQLASGQDNRGTVNHAMSPNVRLMPIGTAIGLQPIGSGQPRRVGGAAMTIEEPRPSEVQDNRLIGSAHHVNHSLVEATIDAGVQAGADSGVVGAEPIDASPAKTSIVLMPTKFAAPIVVPNATPEPAHTPTAEALDAPVATNFGANNFGATNSVATNSGADNSVAAQPASETSAFRKPSTSVSVLDSPVERPAVAHRQLTPVPRFDSSDNTADLQPTIIRSTRSMGTVPHVIEPIAEDTSIDEAAATAQSVLGSPAATQPETVARAVPTPEPVPTPETSNPEPSNPEPISFSMTDLLSTGAPDADVTSETEGHQTDDSDTADFYVDADGVADDDDLQISDDPVNAISQHNVGIDMVEPIVISDPAADHSPIEIQFGDSDDFGNSDDQEDQMIALELAKPIVADPVPTPEPTLYKQRYRSPVAVTAVPVSLGRDNVAATHSVQTAVESNTSLTFDPAAATKPQPTDKAKLTPLYLSLAQVRSLTIGGEVRDVKIANKGVCQAFASGPNQLKLIGTGNGVTQLVVWATPDSKGSVSSPPQMRAFEIHVREEVAAGGGNSPDRTAMLNQSIRRAFPDVDVVVHQRQGELIVSGACGSEATAKKIVRMVRKTCLVPVRDEVVVR